MIASSTVLGRPLARNCVTARSAPNANRKVVCNANATAWDSWTDYMGRRSAVKQPAADELKLFSAIGTSISSSATGFKPKHANAAAPSTFKQVTATFPVVPMSADLHQKLEALALVGLRQAMGLADGAPVDVASSSFTTTDVNAGVLITGCIQQQGSDKIAKIAFVAAETERQASWSRLEGLLLHWACSSAPGDAWHMPPVGWKAIMPNKSADAGGAVQCAFEKKTLPGSQEKVYLLVIEVPISGILRSGGITFVLKASDAQNTKWLKDCSTQKDFFIDVQSLPFTKA